jgi:hypothetical protein
MIGTSLRGNAPHFDARTLVFASRPHEVFAEFRKGRF